MNPELELFMLEMGLVVKDDSPNEQKDKDIYKCLEKGYFNDPRDENGEVTF